MNEDSTNILIAGTGGQGNVLASKILAEAARIDGFNVLVGEVFGISQRGGSVVSHVRIGAGVQCPVSPELGADIIAGLEPMETLRNTVAYGNESTIVFTNTRTIQPLAVNTGKAVYPELDRIISALKDLCAQVITLDATSLAKSIGGAVFTNLVLLGAVSTAERLPISLDSYEQAIRETVPRSLRLNIEAFRAGRKECLGRGL